MVAIFSICLLVILERIFYQVIIESEEKVISAFQLSSDLVTQDTDGTIIAAEITNGFLRFFSGLSDFRLQFLLLTHLLATLYVAVDSYMSTKLLYVTMGVVYLISLLQMFYGGARPFWTTSDILSSSCLQNYTHPSLGLILSVFVPFYAYYCWKKRAGKVMAANTTTELVLYIVGVILVAFIQFLNYFTGAVFLISISLSVVCLFLLAMVLFSMDGMIDNAVKKSTVIKVDAKKYVFYWLLFICLLETFVLIVYSGEDTFLDIDWVQNYVSCTKYQNQSDTDFRYDEVIGPWFNFLQTASIFAWIGAVFGISACYRSMAIPEWCETNMKKRVIRGVIANLMIIPSWLFVVLLEDGSWIKNIGLNEFIVDAVHFFVLYLWLFGYMPLLVLEKGLKLTNREQEDFYVILQDRK